MSKSKSGWVPNRKWAAARVTAVGALATMWVSTGTWDQPESALAVALAVEAVTSYLVPNGTPAAQPQPG